MGSKIKDCPEEKLREIVANSYSYNEVKKKLGYSSNGGSLNEIFRKRFDELGIDYSHFKGMGWNRNSDIPSLPTLKRKIMESREYKCAQCGINNWLGQEIVLQLHHIDGNHENIEDSNLQLLCPNCNSLTKNWCSKNREEAVTDEEFLEALNKYKNVRQACLALGISCGGSSYVRARKLMKISEE